MSNPTLVIRIAGLIEGHRWARGFAEPEALHQVSRIESITELCAKIEDGLRPSERFALCIAGRDNGGTEVRAFWDALPLGEQFRDDRAYLEAFLDGARHEIRARAQR